MPALFQSSIREFSRCDENAVIGSLSAVADRAQTEVTAEQLDAWRQQIRILRGALNDELFLGWHLLLEYPIPRRGKRIDAVILAEGLILVLEFKCGAQKYHREARIQVEDYCLDLRDFHSESKNRVLVPILVATLAEERTLSTTEVVDSVAPIAFSNASSLGQTIKQVALAYRYTQMDPLNPNRWDNAEYAPTPTIIEAARVLYEGQNVREITRCHAGAENLTKTSTAVMRAIAQAKHHERKLICFVTGVPGSGKTLAGLNIVHSRELHQGSLGVFLSGNGPLVRVLSEALARDHARRTSRSIAESRREVQTFIQNVHRFIDAHFHQADPPCDRVIVFDEAQRAWNRDQSVRKFRRDRSEPEIMLEIMDRHLGWAVIVALIGSGQEINTGEAGLREWGRALTERFQHWHVLVSPHVLNTGQAGDAEALFEETTDSAIPIGEEPALHLDVSLRSYRAQATSDFVGYLLIQQTDKARFALASSPEYPIVMTRDLGKARQWLGAHQRGSRRIGLVASSGGRRLRADGLDVRADLDVENWFLNSSSDVRSSYYLETPATEFGVQGLELDWTAVCWDLDLVPQNGQWLVRAFRGTQWQTVQDSTRRQYVLNKYRVLLTRAREGMVIWIPRGDSSDRTRPPALYNSVAAYVKSCGIQEI